MRPQAELGLDTAGVSSSRLAKEGRSSLDNFPMRKLVAYSSIEFRTIGGPDQNNVLQKKHEFRFSLSFVLVRLVR